MIAISAAAGYVGAACLATGLAMLADKNKAEKLIGAGLLLCAGGCAKLVGFPLTIGHI